MDAIPTLIELPKGYIIQNLIGKGSFGSVFVARHKDSGIKVAIKLEHIDAKHRQLIKEAKAYHRLREIPCIPKMHWYGTESEYNIIVLDLMGPSLEDLLNTCNRCLSLKTVLMLAIQMLNIAQMIHDHGFLHRDMKPDNFVMGLQQNSNALYILDFGLAKRYIDPRTKEHIQYIEGNSLIGTARYASISAHEGKEVSRRDDLESIGYILIYLLKGRLPWQGLKVEEKTKTSKHNRYAAIYEKKKSTPIQELCDGLPKEFADYLRAVRQLSFTDKPNYAFYRKSFRNLLNKLEYIFDFQYDWSDQKLSVTRSL